MTFSVRRISLKHRLGVFALAPILLLFGLSALFPPDGVDRAEWVQFIGRFHVLTVHFPIALILLVPVLELAGKSRRFNHLRASVDFVLALATFSAIMAAILGWCLARSGAYRGTFVIQHMWGGVLVGALCWLLWMLHECFPSQRLNFIYSFELVILVGLVSWTGYRGGQLSQGENHLTEHMPADLRDWLGLSVEDKGPSAASNTSFFALRVEPVFAAHCTGCHGASKRKSHLRLDTYEGVMRGGKAGPVVKAGNTQGSEVFHRVTLQVSDDKFMPPEGKRPLSVNEVKLLELWIAAGASPTLTLDAIPGAPENTATPAAEVSIEEIDPVAVAKLRAPLADTVAQLQKRFPDVLEYESRGSADLVIDVSLAGAKFGDEDLSSLKPLYEQIVSADFSGTAVTDRSASSIAAMKRLRVLRLMRTKITDATVEALEGLPQLESLNVFGTEITPAALQVVTHLPRLRHFYAGETKIPADIQVSEALRAKLSF
jgi:uncharacterized membrane protein